MQLIDAKKWRLGRVDRCFELFVRDLTYPETLRFVRWLTKLAGREVANFLGEYLGDLKDGNGIDVGDAAPYVADLIEKLAGNDHEALFRTLWGKSELFDSPTLMFRAKAGADTAVPVCPADGEDCQALVFAESHLSAYAVAAATVWAMLDPSGARG